MAPSLPLRDRRAARLDQVFPLELAAALHADDAVLDDAVVLLVRPNAVEGGLVHPETELRDALRLARLLADDGAPDGRAVRRDRLDDQVVVLRGRVVLRDAPDAGKLPGPRYDPQLVLLLELRAQRSELRDRVPRLVVVAARERRPARRRERLGLRLRGGHLGDVEHRLLRRLEPLRQLFDLAQRRAANRELVGEQHGRDGQDAAADRLAPAVPGDVEHGERAAQAGLRRPIDEAVLAQRTHALLDDRIADLDALAGVDPPQARLQLPVAVLGAELALDEPLAVTERIDDVHREHHFFER